MKITEKVNKFINEHKGKLIIGGVILSTIVGVTIVNSIRNEGDDIESEGLKIINALEKSKITSFHYDKIKEEEA